MKKAFRLAAIVMVLLAFCLMAIGSGSSKKGTETKTQQAETVENPGEYQEDESEEKQEAEKAETEKTTKKSNPNQLGDYEVVIKSAKVTKDYEGEPAVIVTFEFTNNSDETKSWMTAVSAKAFQDGVELDSAFVSSSNKDYDASNSTKEIKPGATINVQKAYELDNTSSDVEIEVSEWLSFNKDTVLTKTFQIN